MSSGEPSGPPSPAAVPKPEADAPSPMALDPVQPSHEPQESQPPQPPQPPQELSPDQAPSSLPPAGQAAAQTGPNGASSGGAEAAEASPAADSGTTAPPGPTPKPTATPPSNPPVQPPAQSPSPTSAVSGAEPTTMGQSAVDTLKAIAAATVAAVSPAAALVPLVSAPAVPVAPPAPVPIPRPPGPSAAPAPPVPPAPPRRPSSHKAGLKWTDPVTVRKNGSQMQFGLLQPTSSAPQFQVSQSPTAIGPQFHQHHIPPPHQQQQSHQQNHPYPPHPPPLPPQQQHQGPQHHYTPQHQHPSAAHILPSNAQEAPRSQVHTQYQHNAQHAIPLTQPPPHSQPPQPSQPLRLISELDRPPKRPLIMDPPRKTSSTPTPAVTGFPSPMQNHAEINPKFVDDCTRLNFAVQQSLSESVRRIVRDNWEKCLLGSEFHQAFVLNASIHHSMPSITRRAVRDFGAKMVREAREELVGHLTKADLDAVVDDLVPKLSDEFLDKCLAHRLLTIEAKDLVNALVKAERLGYEPTDVLAESRDNDPSTNGHAFDQPAAPKTGLQCTKCYRTFQHLSAHDWHVAREVCSMMPPTPEGFEFSCPHCGQGFVKLADLHAHLRFKACGDFEHLMPPKPSRGPGRPPRVPPVVQNSPISIQPAGNGASAHASTPVQVRSAAATPSAAGSPSGFDPYSHLTQEQLDSLNAELKAAEEKYAPKFAEADRIQDESQRRARVEGLRNSFGTKQSMIRKKYGVRLRERRTKAEIQAERDRLGIKVAEKEKAMGSPANMSSPGATGPANRSAVPSSSGWTAANTPRPSSNVWEEREAKRRRIDSSSDYQTPSKPAGDDTQGRRTLSVSQMGGGLSGAAATAETQDPTLPRPSHQRPAGAAGASPGQPIPVNDSSDSSDDEDIPSTLPAQVRKSLAPGAGSESPSK